MRILLHAGLHKSATTYVQDVWRRGYPTSPQPGGVLYPEPPGVQPGHHYLAWPLLEAFTAAADGSGDRGDPDLVLARLTRADRCGSLADVVAEAARADVGWLVLSAEDLDRLRPADVPGLRTALGGHDVTAVLTLARPAHRWATLWQTLVRHGLGAAPRESAPMVDRLARLRPGALADLLALLPAERRVVRLVRSDPPEPDLAHALATSVGLPAPTPLAELPGRPPARNPSLGPDVDLVRRLNAAGRAHGTTPEVAALLDRLRADAGGELPRRPRPDAAAWALPTSTRDAALAEQALLSDPPAGLALRVDDPLGLLPTWDDPTPPPWFAACAAEEVLLPDDVVGPAPDAPDAPGPAEQVWRLRQQHAGLTRRVAALEKRVERQRERIARLRERG